MPRTCGSDVVLLLAAFYSKGPVARSAAGIYGSYLFLHLALTQQRPLYGAKGREGRNSIHRTLNMYGGQEPMQTRCLDQVRCI